MHCSKLDSIESITAFFTFDDIERQQHSMAYGQAVTFIVYWCGHGQPETGNWHFSDGEWLTGAELINVWTSADRSDRDALTIISDTCFSGAWIDELRTRQIPNLAYQAACGADESAWVVDDREVPRSLLMRRFFIELTQEPDRNTDDLVYTWPCPDQHPAFYCQYAQEEENLEEETKRRVMVRGGSYLYRFSSCFLSYQADEIDALK